MDVVLRLGQLSFARGDRAKAMGHVTELEKQNLRAVRPDLELEFDQLRAGLGMRDHGAGPR
jgi:hypothetical protein